MPAPAETQEIFDNERANWYADPRSAFDSWMAQQAFKASSADVYRAQWGLFLEWLSVKRTDLRTVDRLAIEQFVTQLDIRKPQRVRYLRLIERVLDHVRQIEMASTNPARFIAQDGEASWRDARENEPTGFLAHGERAALVSYLFSPLGDLSAGQRWRERRDRALVGAFLGGGVKTGEAAALTVSNYAWNQPWLIVEAANSALNRETRLAPFAIALLDHWISERKTARLLGDLLFPSAPSGRPMHKATMLRAVDAVIEAAGIADSRAARASPQTLRNTFAADLFESGTAPERVGQWLGFQQQISAHRLYRAWQNWTGEEIRERDLAQARESGQEESRGFE
ncbi:integrase [Caballeronia mineralivorans PML1(12)]|uniref:Integrase n=1 Tax=Caballeronia mineralivorans PML1(12) TaxID=908627 RepID=A0A0J1G035_9BURK|nr:tyrosine-type recombinase/integrase [Caballeronia mineralivorans]KLU25543.1 integrase [Caballeronia mineralivorans PML1(12)]